MPVQRVGLVGRLLLAVCLVGVLASALSASQPGQRKMVPVAYADSGTFSNATSIGISSVGIATSYPSNITVSGLSGTVTKVVVTLKNLTHTFPDDIDMLLVGPTGVKIYIMSDTGGSTDITNVTLVLDQAAASSLPDPGPIVSGSFKPTNIGTTDTFASPAPSSPYGSSLDDFVGTNPNGTWQLFIVDDLTGDGGSMAGGWELAIETLSPATSTPTVTSTPTSTVTLTVTLTPTGTLVPTVTATPTVPTVKDEKEESSRSKTEEQRQQEQQTNRSNRDDVVTEGNVMEVTRGPAGLTIVIANVDGLVTIVLPCGSSCPTVRPGDYVEVEGEKVHEQLYEAETVTVVK